MRNRIFRWLFMGSVLMGWGVPWAHAADNVFNNNVGIGTSSAYTSLHVYANNSFPSNGAAIMLEDSSGSNANESKWQISSNNGSFSIFTSDDVRTSGYTALSVGRSGQQIGSIVFSTGMSTERMRIDSGGNLGINTIAPAATLEVERSGTTSPFMVSTLGNDGNFLVVTSSGNVGIGTTIPQRKFEVSGDAYVSGVGGLSAKLIDAHWMSPNADLTLRGGGNSSVVFQISSVEKMRVANSGNVGIGSASPASLLDVTGGAARIWTGAGTVNYATNSGDLYVQGNMEIDGNVYLGDAITDNLTVAGNLTLAGSTTYTGAVTISTTNTSAFLVQNAAGTSKVLTVDTQNGNVGIGTTVPSTKLVVNGSFRMGSTTDGAQLGYSAGYAELKGVDIEGSGYNQLRITTSASPSMVFDTTGNIGIATITPNATLEIQKSGTTPPLMVSSTGSTDGDYVIVTSSGNVGIGSTTPAYALDVNGGVNLKGTNGLYFSYGPWKERIVDDGNSLRIDANGFKVTNSGYGTPVTTYLLINSSGNVGIGTTVPLSTLEVAASGTMAIPVSAAPTVGSTGQVAVDTTADQLQYYGTAKRVLTYKQQKSISVESPSDDDNFILFKSTDPITVQGVYCVVDPADSGESTVITVQKRDSNGQNPTGIDTASITCGNAGAQDDGALSSPSLTAGSWLGVDIGAVTGDVSQLIVTIYYTMDSQ